MFSILVLTACLTAADCKPPQRMSGPLIADDCKAMETRARANLVRNGRIHSSAYCQPYKREQVASK